MLEVGDLKLDPVAHRVERRGNQLAVGPTEYRLLKFFMESPGRVFSRGQLLDGVWGTGSEIEERTVDVHIRRLRKAVTIGNAPDPIRTVRSAGYALEAV
jgi:two-component system phosphate regulon response regulator PhoB